MRVLGLEAVTVAGTQHHIGIVAEVGFGNHSAHSGRGGKAYRKIRIFLGGNVANRQVAEIGLAMGNIVRIGLICPKSVAARLEIPFGSLAEHFDIALHRGLEAISHSIVVSPETDCPEAEAEGELVAAVAYGAGLDRNYGGLNFVYALAGGLAGLGSRAEHSLASDFKSKFARGKQYFVSGFH